MNDDIEVAKMEITPNFDRACHTEEPDDFFIDEIRVGRNNKRLPPKLHDNKITYNEIIDNLRKKKNRSSPGEDGISYKLLKHAGKNLICGLARLFTSLLITGYFPEKWRTVRVRMLPKAGKNLSLSKGWRPISLSSCTAKLFETSIKNRIIKAQSIRGEENIHQAAYKKGRSTQEHLMRLTECVTNAFAQRKSVVAVFLDVEGAFDKVWINGLLWKILKMGLPSNLVKIVACFLENRSLRVQVGDIMSEPVQMKAGTPQGAVISPTLYNIFVDDVIECVDGGVEIAQFADDIALWVADECPRRAELQMNQCLDKLSNWTSKWRVKLAPDKSAYMLFSRRPTHRRMTLNLRLLGQDIQRVQSHRFLGVKFDDKLNWKSCIQEITGSAIPRINALKSISAKSIWRRPDWVIKLHEAVVNSIWKYGSVAFAGMNESTWGKLRKLHASCLKSYAGTPQFIGYETICDHLGVKDIRSEIMDYAKKRIIAMVSFSPFGRQCLEARADPNETSYRGPINSLITNEQRDLLLQQQ